MKHIAALGQRVSLSGALLIAILILYALLARAFQVPSVVEAQGRTSHVLAFYYAWYNPDSFGPGKTAFQPAQPYLSGDGATIQRHVNEAKAAGIDGFVQSWYGPAEPVTNGNFQTLLEIAAGSGFQAAIDFEPATALHSHDERANALQSLLATHANHPAYLRVDGKPVIFFWANWAYSVDDWAYIRSIADPGHNSIWIAEGARTEYLQVFDGLHLYNIAWSANPNGIASTWAANTRAAADSYGSFKYWVATAMPGFDDRHLGRGDASVYRDRAAGAYYQNSFASAAASSPDLLIITSFNEWAEGSNIEPSTAFGNTYLELTAQLISAYKSGGVPPPPPLPEPSSEPASTGEGGDSVDDGGENSGSLAQAATNTPAPTLFASPTPQPDGRVVYEVAEGDTLSAIAFRFNLTLEELYALNELDEAAVLSIGQPIVLGRSEESAIEPGPESTVTQGAPSGAGEDGTGPETHQVVANDTLLAIAIQYNLTMDQLLALNPTLSEDSLLQLGQELVVGQRDGPESVGGSTDFPEGTATLAVTVTTAALEPTAPGQATETSSAPSATATQGLAAVSDPNAVQNGDLERDVAIDGGSQEPESSRQSTPLWLMLVIAFVLVAGVGGVVLYILGARRSNTIQ